jgi:hypothetical protein
MRQTFFLMRTRTAAYQWDLDFCAGSASARGRWRGTPAPPQPRSAEAARGETKSFTLKSSLAG